MRSAKLEALRVQVLSLFHTSEDAKSIALRFQISPKSLRKWWREEYGGEAVADRGKTVLLRSNQSRGSLIGSVKLCPKCGVLTESFRPSSRNPNRYRGWCSCCEAKATQRWRENLTPDKRVQQRLRQKAYNETHYAEHAEEFRAYARQYRLDHPEYKDTQRYHFIAHPDQMLLHNAKKRAVRFGVPFDITIEDVQACIPTDGVCPITRQPFERGVGQPHPSSMSLDRITPALGYVRGNIAVVSHRANTMKNAYTDPTIFMRMADYVEGNLRVPLGGSGVSPPKWMIKSAKARAKAKGLLFGITKSDLEACIPSDGCCPVTGGPLRVGEGVVTSDSMSLDRINPELGYVPGNIAVISHLANTIKQNCTDPDAFRRIADYIEAAGSSV